MSTGFNVCLIFTGCVSVQRMDGADTPAAEGNRLQPEYHFLDGLLHTPDTTGAHG